MPVVPTVIASIVQLKIPRLFVLEPELQSIPFWHPRWSLTPKPKPDLICLPTKVISLDAIFISSFASVSKILPPSSKLLPVDILPVADILPTTVKRLLGGLFGPVPIPTKPSTLTCVADKTSVVVIDGSIIFGLVLHLFSNSGLPSLLTLNTISLLGSELDSNTISEAFNLLGKLEASLNSISPSLSVLIFVPLKSIVLPAMLV